MRGTDFAPLREFAGPYRKPRRQRAARLLMRAAALLIDAARWLLGPRP